MLSLKVFVIFVDCELSNVRSLEAIFEIAARADVGDNNQVVQRNGVRDFVLILID